MKCLSVKEFQRIARRFGLSWDADGCVKVSIPADRVERFLAAISAPQAPSGQQAEPTDEQIRAGVRAFQSGHNGFDDLSDWRAFYRTVAALAGQQSERPACEICKQYADRGRWCSRCIGVPNQSERPAPARFSCHLERDFGKAPCDHDCGKLRCMYPSKPAPAGQAVEALTKAREFVKSRKAPGYDGPCMDAIRNIDKGIAALAASQAERPAVKEDGK